MQSVSLDAIKERVPNRAPAEWAALAPFGATPHWGKLFLTPPRPDRREEFGRLADTLDPRGAFRNDWLAVSVGP